MTVVAGFLIVAIGLAALFDFLSPLADYSYAIVWWGILLLADTYNLRRRGLSLWGSNPRHFLAVTLPASVVLWLVFEALNFPAPQWRYRGQIIGVWPKVLFGFVSFSTVIPIMVEFWWLTGGRQCIPAGLLRWLRRYRLPLAAAALVFAILPFVNQVFWFNQGIWLVPALLLLPTVQAEDCSTATFLRSLVVSSLLAGIVWETLNYPASTHWEYLIMPNLPHLFYMPIPGYIGFIPFGVTSLAAYQFQLRVEASVRVALLLYGTALAGLYWLTLRYMQHGLWQSG